VAADDEDHDQRELRFCRLYKANFRPVQAYAVNGLARPDDAADIVAEVFMIAWRRLADVPPSPHDRFWLYGMARRVISKRYRSASRWHNLLGRLAAEQRPTVHGFTGRRSACARCSVPKARLTGPFLSP
jgi:RNA polymerase sigma-70 factor, ECF subfamily